MNYSKFTEHLLDQGKDVATEEQRPYIRLCNLNGLIFFAVDIVLSIIFFLALDDLHISIGLLTASFSFLIGSIGLNHFGRTTLSRISTVSIGSILCCYCAFYLGRESFVAGSLLLGAIFPFVYFSIKEIKEIFICILVPVFCYLLLIYFDYTLGHKFDYTNENTIKLLQFIFFIIPMIGIAANTYAAVSQREQKNSELIESKAQIEMILNALSHDLANPIQIVSIISESSTESSVMPTEKIQRLSRASEQINRIFNKLTKMTVLTNGKTELNMDRVSVDKIINDSIQLSLDTFDKKNIRIIKNLNCPKTKILVDIDVFTFQILINFFTNAIKFSNKDTQIQISTQKINNKTVHIIIQDWGLGIEPSRINNLMSWKKKSSTLGTCGEKGTGFGLPIAHQFIKMMNGTLQIVSKHKDTNPTEHGTKVIIGMPAFDLI